MLKYKSDYRTILFQFIFFVLIMSTLLVQKEQLFTFKWLFFFCSGTFLVFCSALINHNHRHYPIFRNSRLNQAFSHIITLSIGAPSGRLHAVHHFNHHMYYQDARDLATPAVHAKGKGLLRILTYLYYGGKSIAKNRKEISIPLKLKEEISREQLILWIFILAAMTFNPLALIFLTIPIWIVGLFLLFTSNLFNHDFCDLKSNYNHSRNFLNGFENYIFFNNGYHSAHHLNPGLHWSQLPGLHQKEFLGKMDPQLNEGSFFFYLSKYILFSYDSKSH